MIAEEINYLGAVNVVLFVYNIASEEFLIVVYIYCLQSREIYLFHKNSLKHILLK